LTKTAPILPLLLLAAPAAAQSFNIDVGPNLILAPAPPPSYGAAAVQTGHWMAFRDPFFSKELEGLDGVLTTVTLESDTHSSFTVYPSVIPTSGDQELMEDAQWLPNLDVPVTWTFSGLKDGLYTLYTYACDPSSDVEAQITVVGSSDPPQVVQGAWPGSHQLGWTYARHSVDVSDGTLTVIALGWGDPPYNTGALNGFQLLYGGDGEPIGDNYCGPANLNSTGQSAQLSAYGSEVAAVNNVRLDAVQMPPNQFGLFVNSMTQGFSYPPGSQGILCLSGGIGRHTSHLLSTGASGTFSLKLDLTDIPTPGGSVSVLAGETWNWQAWFRDKNPGNTSNFTDGLAIAFQ